jgi:hypothetical protein
MSRNIPWSEYDDQQLGSLALSGFSLAEIAHQMVRSKSSVRSRALKIEIAIAHDRNPMRKPQRPSSDALRFGLKAKGTGWNDAKGDNPALENHPEWPSGGMHACQCGDAGVPCPES